MSIRGRREVFTSLFGGRTQKIQNELCVVRPPYHQEGFDFEAHCLTCKETPCVQACDEEIILLSATHTPCLDFTKRGCTFCEACARACDKGVLALQEEQSASIAIDVRIDVLSCMAWHNSLCNSCLDACDTRAIQFLGLFRPEILSDACTGCGMCIPRCPTQAIRFSPKEAS